MVKAGSRFDVLPDDDDGGSSIFSVSMDTTAQAEISSPKIPPIIIKTKIQNVEEFYKTLSDMCSVEVNFRSNNGARQVLTYQLEDYVKVKEYLKSNNYEYYSYTAKELLQKKLVLRGIDKTISCKTILQDLQKQTKHVVDVKQMTIKTQSNTQNDENTTNNVHKGPIQREKIGIYVVYFQRNAPIKQIIQEIHVVYYHKVTWEKYIRKKGYITQCGNCQLFGHASVNCNLKSKCLKCGENHTTITCAKKPEDKPKCANCGEDHVASYRQCESYKKYIRMRQEMAQKRKERSPKTYTPKDFQQSIVKSDASYANITKQNITANLPTPSTSNLPTGTSSGKALNFLQQEIQSLFNMPMHILMQKCREFIPEYIQITDQFEKKTALLGFVMEMCV
ncbi:hypothetical protein DMENIID0001_085460 [Sergentomyia squamirostris]